MPEMTCTEALADIKTIDKRIGAITAEMYKYLLRPSKIIDPLEDSGGSAQFVREKRQAITDLMNRRLDLRTALMKSNLTTTLEIAGTVYSIQQWLVWKREIAPIRKQLLITMSSTISQQRMNVTNQALRGDGEVMELVVNISEKELADDLEAHETIMGTLDGHLSRMAATTIITIN